MPASDVLDRLAALALPEGGWGYQPGQPAHIEPTCLAMIALSADAARYGEAVSRAHNAVIHPQLVGANGVMTLRLARGRPQAAWPTSLGLAMWAATGVVRSDVELLADGLLAIKGKVLKADPEVADMMDIDVSLMGWPWAEDTFSWVEPTAWACLALRMAGRGGEPRVQEGLRLLLDRAFDTGGANYGNRIILGRMTEPIPGPTAVLLIALQGVTDQPRIDAAKGYLRVQGEKTTDLEHLAWIKLALACHADDEATRVALPQLDARIRDSLAVETAATAGLGAGPLRLALAALALDTESRNPFRLSDPPKVAAGKVVPMPTEDPAAAPVDTRSFGEKVKAKFRNFLLGGLSAMRALPPSSAVHIGKCDSYDGPLLDLLKKVGSPGTELEFAL